MTEQKHTNDPLNVDEALSTSEAFLIKNKNVLLGAVVALVVIVGGFLGYKHFISEPNELKASEAIFKGEQYFGADNFEVALKGDSLGICRFCETGRRVQRYRCRKPGKRIRRTLLCTVRQIRRCYQISG